MKTTENHIIVKGIEKYFLLGILIVLLVTLMIFISPLLSTLLIAAVIVTAIFPVHKWLFNRMHVPENTSAFLTLLFVTLIIIAPFTAFFFLLANEASEAYIAVSAKINILIKNDVTLIPQLLRESVIGDFFERIAEYAPISIADVIGTIGDFFGQISKILITQSTNILKHLSVFLLQIIVFFIALFYFIRDGEKLVRFIYSLLPLSHLYRKALFHKLNQLSYAIIYGIFGAAIAQGFLVGLGFFIAGIDNAPFWGTLAGLASPVPYIGTSIIWVPAVVLLFIGGHWVAGIFLIIWGVAVVGIADNIVKPYLIGSSTALQPFGSYDSDTRWSICYRVKRLVIWAFRSNSRACLYAYLPA